MKEVNKNLAKQMIEHMEKLGDEKVNNISNSILNEAKALTPVNTGRLKESAVIIQNGTTREVIFQEPYALYVHENLNARHIRGEAKFLEKAVLKTVGGYK